ncbi:ABC transporter permease subunit [Mycoplasmopsis opalescens]|uniref:ABC transporter permease subunit n=1 Tax=Mycoplasmopsis opalescens TaxID=114886 RepID=UPI0004A71344|nr:ABC transporter permease subunit [Mycoplasmopsis opalescens]
MFNPFALASKKLGNNSCYPISKNPFKQYWERFFRNKLNLTLFILFWILLISLLFATFFIRNSPISSIDSQTTLVNNLPSEYNREITRSFQRGYELDFIRNIEKIETKLAYEANRNPIFSITFDSARDLGGEQTIHTDTVTLIYNPYNLILAINSMNENKINLAQGLFLGTNSAGIDIYSRIVVSIWVTFAIIFIAIFINIIFGFNLAVFVYLYRKNFIVKFLTKLIDALSVIPEIIWVFLLSIFLGTNWYSLLISLIIVCWISYYKFCLDQVIILYKQEFILAAKSTGSSDWKIAYNHIFSYVYADILIIMVERFSINILIASGLAFLDFINETNNINIGSVLKEAIILIHLNPAYLITISSIIFVFTLVLKLLSTSFANNFNPKLV